MGFRRESTSVKSRGFIKKRIQFSYLLGSFALPLLVACGYEDSKKEDLEISSSENEVSHRVVTSKSAPLSPAIEASNSKTISDELLRLGIASFEGQTYLKDINNLHTKLKAVDSKTDLKLVSRSLDEVTDLKLKLELKLSVLDSLEREQKKLKELLFDLKFQFLTLFNTFQELVNTTEELETHYLSVDLAKADLLAASKGNWNFTSEFLLYLFTLKPL